jgi:hypothetical protein
VSDKKSAGVYMKNLLEPQPHRILQIVEMQQAPTLVLWDLPHPLFPESFPIDSVAISNVRYKAGYILTKRQSRTNEEDSGSKSAIAFPFDCLQLGEFVEAIASRGVTTSQSPLDESPPHFIEIASRHANQLLSKIINEGTKDPMLIQCYLEALHQKEPGFTYKIGIASADGSRCGYV